MNIEDKNFHEAFLAKKYVKFGCLNTSPSYRHNFTSGNVKRFFRGKAELLKDSRDIEEARKSNMFVEIKTEEDEVKLKEDAQRIEEARLNEEEKAIDQEADAKKRNVSRRAGRRGSR